MPAYTNKKTLGTLPVIRQPLAATTGSSNYAGTYGWSAFRARFGQCTNTTFTATLAGAISAGDAVALLLFTTDVPVLGMAFDVGTPGAIAITGLVSSAPLLPFLVTTSGGGTSVPVLIGEVGKGYVGTVQTTGFPAYFLSTVTESSTIVDLAVIANGSQGVTSPVSWSDWDNPSTALSGNVPVLIPATSYTSVIQAAGNQIVTNTGVVYQVVGLYSVIVP
jgi:hypothetical protein